MLLYFSLLMNKESWGFGLLVEQIGSNLKMSLWDLGN